MCRRKLGRLGNAERAYWTGLPVDGSRLECALEAGILGVAVVDVALVELDEVHARRDAALECPGEVIDRATEFCVVGGLKAVAPIVPSFDSTYW